MVIESLIKENRNLFWTLFHVALGLVCTITPYALIGWFYFILITNFFKSNRLLQNNKPILFLLLFSYLISFELLDRMTKTSPFIPFELGKYFLLLMGILGLVNYGVKQPIGIWMAILITPAVFYDFSGKRVFFDIINYYLAPLSVGLGIAFSHKIKVNDIQINQILKLIWLACLSSLVFTFIKTPDFDEISFSLGANFDTTAGHASNQVATVLGLGMFLSFYSFYKKLNFSGNRILDILCLFGFTFQGLLSFSRGGIMVGAAGILLLMILNQRKLTNVNNRSNSFLLISIISIVAIYSSFELANSISGGNLLLRYQGETQGTLLGNKEKTLDNVVTGRLGIFQQDIQLWYDHIFTGVGVGASRFMRNSEREGVAPHVELSRLLADHGLLGLVYAFYFFIYIPLITWNNSKTTKSGIISKVLVSIAVLTTFHAAMRTFLTPLFIIIGSLNVVDSNLICKTIKSTTKN